MKRGAAARAAATMTVLASMLAASETAAQDTQGLRLGNWAGEVELGFALERQQTRTEGSPESDFEHRRLRERIGIRNQGWSIVDPRLISGNIGLTVDWYQDHDRQDGTPLPGSGRLPGYSFDTTFLSGMPYNATIYANRNQSFLTQPFGGRIQQDLQNLGTTLRLREDSFLMDEGLPYFSSSLNVYQDHIQETTTGLGTTFVRDELRNVLSLDAHKGFETADLDARYEYNDLNNIAYSPGSFQAQTGILNYSQDFGPDLSRRWESRLFYSDRTGQTPTTFFTVDERIRFDHYKNLYSDYRYLYTRMETQGGITATGNGYAHLQHQLYRSLTTDAQAFTTRQELPTGTRTSYAGQLDFDYRRSLPSSGQLYARAGGRYQVDDNKLSSSQVSVVDEPHAAPSPLGAGAGFLLNQSFVIASTIVMVDIRGGARLPTAEGIDYDVVPEGNLTRIVPLVGSAVIQGGDPLVVSYTYELDPSAKWTTDTYWVNAGADFRWIAFFLGHEQTNQTLLSGASDQFLEDRLKDTAQIDLRGTAQSVQAEASAAFTRYDATHLAYTQRRFTELVRYRPASTLVLSLNAEQTYIDYTLPERESEIRAVRLTLDWFTPGGWTTTTVLGRRIYRDTLVPTEILNEASFRARWTYGKLDIDAIVSLNDRTRGDFQMNDRRLGMRAIRRF